MAAEDLGDLQAEILEVKHAILEAPKQPKKQTRPRRRPAGIDPAKGPKKDQIRTGPGRAKFPDSAVVKICVLFNTNPI